MSTYVQEAAYEPVTDIIVVDSASAEPEPILELHEETPLQTTTATTPPPRQSRLSMAFNRLSCGFCFHPYKNNFATDYHALVHTPTEEDGPILGDEDYLPEDGPEYLAFASTSEDNIKDEDDPLDDDDSSSEQGPSTSDGDKATKELAVTSAIEDEDDGADEGDESEAQPTDSVTDLVQDTSPALSLLGQPLVTPVTTATIEPEQTTDATATTGKKGAKSPVVKAFAKLKLRRSSSSTSSSPSPSTPSSPPASPMLLGRITNRFSKITRTTKESSTSSSTSKVDSLKVNSEPSAEATAAVIAAVGEQQDLQVDYHETVLMDGDDNDDQEPLILTEEPMEMRLPAAQPVAIPSSSATEAWAQSPTLHQTDASAGTAMSGQTLVKLSRSSTVGSTVGGESETGSVKSSGSGKEAKDAIAQAQPQQEEPKRKGSMMKKIEKFGKIIKSEKRKSTGDSYLSRRLSRRGSSTLQSPVEVENAH